MSSNNTSICRYLSAEEAEHYVYTTADTILIVAVLPAISIIGILDMKTTTNIYIENLAVGDEMLLTIYISLFSFASVFFVSLVALERYMAICRQAIHRQTNNRARAVRLSLVS